MRPKTATTNAFSFRDLAAAGQFTSHKIIQLLDKTGELPTAFEGIRRLKRIGVISGLMAGCASLIEASRFAAGVLTELNQSDGEIPSNLDRLCQQLPADQYRAALSENEYERHLRLLKNNLDYAPIKPMKGDVCIQVADRKHLFQVQPFGSDVKFLPSDGDEAGDASYIGEIVNFERSDEAQFVSPYTLLPEFDHPDYEGRKNAMERVANAARGNATSLTTVNLSLAIRKAFVRLDAYRGTPNEGASA